MDRKTAILVLGDPGPVRHELLVRGDIETLWVSHASDVLAVLREGRPAVCLVSAEMSPDEVQLALDMLGAHGRVPAILLVDPYATTIDPRLAARASAIIPAHRTDSILALVGLHTGLSFAKDPRANIEALVRVYLDDEEYVLETSNLSVSGVAIRNFPPVPEGTMVHVELELSGATVIAEARVIRFGREKGLPLAALSFVRINRAQRERIMRVVEAARREAARPELHVHDLFGDLTADLGSAEALKTSDLEPASQEETPSFDAEPELELIGAWLTSDGWPVETPDWLVRVGQELTTVERSALVGGEALDWALSALRMRVCLARARFAVGDAVDPVDAQAARIPSSLADEAYRMFVNLADRASGATDNVVTQISRIRAALLRDLLAAGPRPRSGTVRGRFDEGRELEDLGDSPFKDPLGARPAVAVNHAARSWY